MNNAYCQVRNEFFAKALSSMLFTAFSLTDISLTYITDYIFKTLLVIHFAQLIEIKVTRKVTKLVH